MAGVRLLGCTWGVEGPWAPIRRLLRPGSPWSSGGARGAHGPGSPGSSGGARGAHGPGSPGMSPLDLQVPRDVLLFQHERRGLFLVVGFFCTGQFLFWSYLAHFAFTTLRDTGTPLPEQEQEQEQEDRPLLPSLLSGSNLNLGSNKWRYGFTASCLTIGSLIMAASYIFSRRSVNRVLLHRGGRELTLTTYYPFGPTSSFTVPLRHVSCMVHRTQVAAMLPVKVKGRSFYYLLDKDGKVYNARLFDLTVGTYRKL